MKRHLPACFGRILRQGLLALLLAFSAISVCRGQGPVNVEVPGGPIALPTAYAGTPGASTSFPITINTMPDVSGSFSVNAPGDVQVSADNSTWSSSYNISYSSAEESQATVYVRINDNAPGGVDGNIVFTDGQTIFAELEVSGTVVVPTITVPGGTVTLNGTTQGTAGQSTSFSISAANLTSAEGTITVTAAPGVQVSYNNNTWSSSDPEVVYADYGATISNATVYVRLSGDGVPGPISVTLTLSGGGASATQVVVGALTTAAPNFSYSSPQSYTVGVPIVPLMPANSGSAVLTYSINTLPAGLNFNEATGIISGTPTNVTAATNYHVTGINAAGYDEFTINISVTSPALDILGLSAGTPATGAYSLRLLRSVYTGPLARILMNGNYYDVYPDATSAKAFSTSSPVTLKASATDAVTTAGGSALSSVIGSNSATVVTWYDQSGNGNDVTQPNTGNQPQIINAGVINTSTGTLAGMLFNGNNTYLRAVLPSLSSTTPHTLNAIAAAGTGSIVALSSASAGNQNSVLGAGDANNTAAWYGGYSEDTQYSVGVSTTTLNERTKEYTPNTITGYFNGTSVFSNTSATYNLSTPDIVIGAQNNGADQFLNGSASEVLVFTSALSDADRQTIENNQYAYYGIPALSTISSLTLNGQSPTSAASLNYTATFSTAVSGLTASNFSLTETGTAVGTISSVTGSGTTYTVNITGVSGAGTLTLNFINSSAILPGNSNSFSASPVTVGPLSLDVLGLTTATPATGAYSLRLLRSSYTGPLVRISIVNSTNYYDVYPDATTAKAFSANSPITLKASATDAVTAPGGATLSTIISGNFALVVTWYDQSGNGNDAVQTSSTHQPQIIVGGAINTSSGFAGLLFDGRASYMRAVLPSLNSTTPHTLNGIAAAHTGSIVALSSATSPDQNSVLGAGDGNNTAAWYGGYAEDANYSVGTLTTALSGRTKRFSPDTIAGYFNGGQVFSAIAPAYALSTPDIMIGVQNNGVNQFLNGSASEVLVFTSALSNTDRQTVESNQAVYYGLAVPTTINSLTLTGATSPTSASTLNYTATFATGMSGLTTSNFSLTATGTATGTINSVTASGTSWNVNLTGVGGSGTLTLNFINSINLIPAVSNSLSSSPVTLFVPAPTLSYSSPQSYVINTAITPLTPTSGYVAAQGYSSTPTGISGLPEQPDALAVDAAGNVYAITGGVIYKAAPGGNFSSSYAYVPVGGPSSIAVDAAGNIYAGGPSAGNIFEIRASDHSQINIGTGLSVVRGLAVDINGNVYVGELGNFDIKEIHANNGSTTTVINDGGGPDGIAVDNSGNIYVAPVSNSFISEIPAGSSTMINLGSNFAFPAQVAVDAGGDVFVANAGSNNIQEIPAGNGPVITLATGLSNPTAIAVDAAGNVYYSNGSTVEKLAPVGGYYTTPFLPVGLNFNTTTGVISGTPTTVTAAANYTVTGYNSTASVSATVNIAVNPLPPTLSYSSPPTYITGTAITPLTPTSSGVAAQAYSSTPTGISGLSAQPNSLAVDAAGNVYAITGGNIYKAPPGGSFSLLYANLPVGVPSAIAVDAAGNLYAGGPNASYIVEIRASDQSQINIGSGLSEVQGVAVDIYGNVYATETNNHDIKEIHANNGQTSTVVSGLNLQGGVAVDNSGSIYVAPLGGPYINEIPAGSNTTVNIGSGIGFPEQVAVDAAGDIFVAALSNSNIDEIPAGNGPVITLATGLSSPTAVAVDAAGNVYYGNGSTVEKLAPVGGYYTTAFLPAGLNFNSSTGVISGTPTTATAAANYTVTAWNSGGSISAPVNIAVNPLPPTLSYSGPQTYVTGTAITPLTPTSSGVAAQAYSSAPTGISGLPAQPDALAVDAAGNVYAIENGSIYKAPPGGSFSLLYANLPVGFPSSIAVDAAGNLYAGGPSASYIVEIRASDQSQINIGFGLSQVQGVAVDINGNVYVCEEENSDIKEIHANNGSITVTNAVLGPDGIAVDNSGNIYVADEGSPTISEIPAGSSTTVHLGLAFSFPAQVAVDAGGDVFVADKGFSSIQEIPAGNGPVITLASGLSNPTAVAVDAAGNVYYSNGSTVEKLAPVGGFYTSLSLPAGLTFNTNTGVISGTPTTQTAVANYTVTAWNAGGSISAPVNIATHIPTPLLSYSGPQTYSTGNTITPLTPNSSGVAAPGYSSPQAFGATFTGLQGVATDAAGNVYVADNTLTSIIEYPVGGGASITVGSGLSGITAMAVDAAGNVYVSESSLSTLLKLPVGGGAAVPVGSGLSSVVALAIDPSGNIFASSSRYEIYKISAVDGSTTGLLSGEALGLVSNGAGYFYATISGEIFKINASGTSYTAIKKGLNSPGAIAMDVVGNIYFVDATDNQILELPAGSTSLVTVATGFNAPDGVAVDSFGNIYVADAGNNTIKKVTPSGGYYLGNALPGGLSLNNATGVISGTPTTAAAAANYTVTAYNAGGGTSAMVNLAVNLALPALSYSNPQTYVVNTPIAALSPTSANIAALAYSNTPTFISGAYGDISGIAVDTTGNVFYSTEGAIYKAPQGGAFISTPYVSTSAAHAGEIAIDAAGNVYYAGYAANSVTEFLVSNQSKVNLGTGWSYPFAVTLDNKGDLFVIDGNGNSVKEIVANNGATVTLASGLAGTNGIAVDAAGNIYLSFNNSSSIEKIPAGGGAIVQVGSGFSSPAAVAVDAAGDLFVADNGAQTISEIPAGTNTVITLATDLGQLTAMTIDRSGNLYYSNAQDATIGKIAPTGGYFASPDLPAGLSFNPNTGVISGTPTAVTAAANYTITGWNGAGSATATVSIAVIFGAPVVSSIKATTPANTNPTNSKTLAYTVTFSEPVTGVDGSDFTGTKLSGTLSYSSITVTPVNDSVYTVTLNTVSGNGAIRLDLNSSGTGIQNLASTAISGGYTLGDVYTIDNTAPNAFDGSFLSSNTNNTYAKTGDVVTLAFTTSETVQTPSITIAGHLVTATNMGGNSWQGTYTETAGDTEGQQAFSFTITDIAGNSNTYTSLETSLYVTFDKTPPAVTISAPSVAGVSTGGTGSVSYTIKYSDVNFNSSNLTSAGVTLNKTGTATGTVGFSGSGKTYTVNITGISGLGAMGISVAGGYSSDLAGNIDIGAGPSATFNVLNNDAVLSNLLISNGTLSPGFNSGKYSYAATVGNGLANINITPTVHDPNATVTVNGTPATSGSATAVALTTGTNTITMVVTAQDGTTKQTYTLTVNEVQSANDNLASVKTSAGLAQGLTVPSTLTESVVNAVTSLTVTPTVIDPTATVKVNGQAVPSGNASGAIALNVGANTITIVVTAQDNKQQSYTLTVTRAPSSNDKLSNLTVSSGTLSPAFGTATNYLNYVANGIAFSITPTLADPTAKLTINGNPAPSGTPTIVPLQVGNNTVTVVVTAQDNVSTKTYTVVVNEARSPNNTLFSLITSAGLAQGQTVPTTLSEGVPNATSSITVTPTMADNTATVTVNGTAVTSGSASAAIALSVGANTITIVGTAQNGTTLTYTLTVTRAASSLLANLTATAGSLNPVFSPVTTSYAIYVPNGTAGTTFTPTAAGIGAKITVNGTTVTTGTASQAIALPIGNTINTIIVTAADNSTTTTYIVGINRARSSDDALASLKTSAGLAKGKTVPATLTESVVNAVSSITVTPTVDDTTATVTVNGQAVTSGTASPSIPLAVGPNIIITTVTAQNGVTQTYTLTVTRAPGSNNDVYQPVGVQNFEPLPQLADDGINVHQGISPNGDGIDDYLQIDNISNYPDNNLKIMNRNGLLVYEAKGYDNATRVFDGHSNKNGQMQLPGTYFYELDYTVNGVLKHKTGFLVLKY